MSAGNKVLRDIVTDLEAVLNKCGVMYHVFYRTKSEMSKNLKNIVKPTRRCKIYWLFVLLCILRMM